MSQNKTMSNLVRPEFKEPPTREELEQQCNELSMALERAEAELANREYERNMETSQLLAKISELEQKLAKTSQIE